MLRKSHVEFALSLVSTALFWVALPIFNIVNTGIAPVAMAGVIVSQSVLMYFASQLFEPARRFVTSGVNGFTLLTGAISCNVILPILFVELMLFVTGSAIISRPNLYGAVVGCLCLQCLLLLVTAPWREYLVRVEKLGLCKLTYGNDGAVYRMVVRKGTLVRDGLFVVGDDRLSGFYSKVSVARHFYLDNQEQAACEQLQDSLPELKGCGYDGNLLFQVAFAILKQSYALLGDKVGATICSDYQAEFVRLQDDQMSLMID